MDYRKQIHPEFVQIAKNFPYNRGIIACANLFQALCFRLTPVPGDVTHTAVTVAGYQGLSVRADVFEPAGAAGALPGLLYVHGGAFSYKAAAYHKKLACTYAARASCRVYFPDYHLTPRHPYPAAYYDVLSLYQYMLRHAPRLGIQAERIGMAGDSAGASIAALICNNYARENLRPPCLQMLVYPLTDISMRTDSMERFSDTPLWNAKNNRRMWRYYCGNLSAEDARGASPMHSRLPQIIPDAYIETAEYDCLHDEGVIYAQKLRDAGANVQLNETKGTIHGYDCAFHSQIAACAIETRISFLKKGFRGGAPL